MTRPAAILFDVNETLSDMAPMADRFAEVGAAPGAAKLWFAALLRDGFALTAAGENPAFADVGASVLRGLLRGEELDRGLDAAVQHIMDGMSALELHPDVVPGIGALKAGGFRLATLSNGSTALADKLFSNAGVRDDVEQLLSVTDAPAWKPDARAYRYAAGQLGVDVSELLLVAVHPWDIHGASSAGAQTAWINRSGGAYPDHFRPADHTVRALPELAEVLV
ncbi:haloacid dehalogenase type II [Pseudarthrobacter sp. NPDC058362]|uniref:haloacid dehalogenase type II n=1 Tax=Pseudarthrobacter sp. NPDC058362 TaxID=3346458 RepID=UPI00364676A8